MAVKLWNGVEWIDVDQPHAYDAGQWKALEKIHAYGFGSDDWGWYQVWPESVAPPTNPGGTYTLDPHTENISTSQGGLSWARFNLGNYAGKITAVKATIAWLSRGSMPSSVLGNGSGTYYRSISYEPSFANRTISHDLGSTAVSQFNSGSATGYTIDPDTTNTPSVWIGSLRLQVTVSG